MDEIVDQIKNNLKDTPNKRIGDVNILFLARVIEESKERMKNIEKKLNNGITTKLDKIWGRINSLPCEVHLEIIKRIEETIILKIELAKTKAKSNCILIRWLFALYGLNILGIVAIGWQLIILMKK